MAAKKAPQNDDSNASDFIRSLSTSMTAPQVVAAGKKAGFDFSTSLVYAVRGRMRKAPAAHGKRESAPAASRRGTPSAAPSPKAVVGGGGRLEAQIQSLVGEFVQQMAALVRRAALDAVREALDRGR